MPLSSIEIDVERLLAPVSAEAPAGASLRYEGTYDRVREARREDDPTLPQGVWVARLKAADWSAVAAICGEALERRSKDLQLAVWLAEAWLHRAGAGGAAPGLRLVAGLCDRYWDGLFPELGDEGAEPRANLIEWLDDAAARRLRLLAVPQAEGQPPFSLSDWEAGRGAAPGGPTAEAPAAGQDALLARVSLIDRGRWAALHAEVSAALTAAEALERALAAHIPSPPTLHRTRGALRGISALVQAAVGEIKKEEPPTGAGAADEPLTAPAIPPPARAPGAPPRTRAEAYRQLADAADYLLRTEPHSPVPYLVKRAISWGNMSLAELLGEFVSSADDLVTIHRLLGIRGRDDGAT